MIPSMTISQNGPRERVGSALQHMLLVSLLLLCSKGAVISNCNMSQDTRGEPKNVYYFKLSSQSYDLEQEQLIVTTKTLQELILEFKYSVGFQIL